MERRPPMPHSRPLPRPPMKKQNPPSSKEMDEVDAMINQFASAPKFYDGTRMKSQINTITAPKVKSYEPIDWKLAFPQCFILAGKIPVYINGDGGPTILCLHGAGHSGLSFAPIALLNVTHRIVSFDFRGHGMNKMTDDLSTELLINDTIDVLQWIERSFKDDNIILIGHSMGGSIATKTCDKIFTEKDKYKELYEKIQGLIVIDVVEGTAIAALPFMENIVNNRPTSFPSLEKAIQYMNKSGTIRNVDSARISVPPLLKEDYTGGKVTSYSWITNLMASEKYWTDWFNGLTKAFLKVQVPKILMLAGAERMDKELTIAQMQGKFMLSIVRGTGHVIHEDNPKKVMDIIEDFLETFHIKPKLSEMTPVIGKLGNYTPTMIKYDKTQK